MQKEKAQFKIQNFYFLVVVFSFSLFLFNLSEANAASLYFSPQSGSFTTNDNIAVNVMVQSQEQTMNAASGVISFPADKLQVSSLSKIGSIFSLWVQEPSFSNSAGTINFEGIVLNPGFIGSGGKIFTINFKAKSAGAAALNFSSGSVLANDGQGTNILTSLGNGQFNIQAPLKTTQPAPAETPTTPSATAATGAPLAPIISSPTHSDPEKWYNNNKPKFTWRVPSGVSAVKLLFDRYPNSQPAVLYAQPISEKQLDEVADGVWYFHCQFKNASGWGKTGHFKFQIDTQPPEPITIQFVDGKVVEQPRIKVTFNTVDALSGIDYYKIKISGELLSSVSSTDILAHNPYTLPPQSPGNHSLEVLAFDKAGNVTTATEEFIIKPALAPRITDFPQRLSNIEFLEIKGETAYPKAHVILFIQKDSQEPNSYQIITDQDGKFAYTAKETLPSGAYTLWVFVTDEQGSQSNSSEKVSIVVSSSVIFSVGSWAVSFLVVIVPLAALIFILLFILWYGWHKFQLMRKRLRKEVREVESALRKAFNLLKEDIREQIKMLEKTRTKRQLTEEEEKIIKRLKRNLDDAEKLIRKEIEDIEKEIKQ